ncbi:TKL protein kinase [Aphanomyces invadans]|uniref:TKL protein kinase n=1 Tax=Aphanomyces invadans TaxID=157072 RepID=A0A024TA67_9STRA|nr:TKL protein kinase [Aphanomyces invadans]ETV90511.1 TKL protein kinase [Aphanomyces invadans]|eukprot:XP_008880827.1 TKL protein kinase [Aphanomyces invadans]
MNTYGMPHSIWIMQALLHYAEEGDIGQVSSLLSSGADVNAPSDDGRTPLFMASKNGHVDVVKFLIKYNANVNQADTNGWTPLLAAVVGQHVQVAQVLLRENADPNARITGPQLTSLYIAVSSGNEELVRLLLQYQADATLCTSDGKSPLEAALQKQHATIAALLVTAASVAPAEASVAPIDHGTTLAHQSSLLEAIEANDISTIVRLIKAQADVNHAGPDGTLPLCLAALLRRESVVGMLLIAKADGNKANGCGGTALTIAASNGDVTIVDMLLQDGVNINSTDSNQNTPLLLAVQHGHSRIVQRLLDARADVTRRNADGETALVVAMKYFRRDEATILHAFVAQPPVTIDPSAIRVVEKLGFGGVKFVVERAVYRGKDVAIKSALTRQDTPALLAEADAISSGNSPYVISLVGKTDEADRPHLVVDFMDQGNLRQHLDTKLAGTCTTSGFTTPHVAWVLANALLDLHEKGLVHRDLRSEHVLLSTTEHVKVAHLGGAHTRLMNMSMAELLWTAPEILLGESTSPAADVYAFGVILTELDTLQRPYWDLSLDPWALTDSIRKGVIRPSISSSSPLWFKELVDSCLAFNPIERPSAKTIVEILEKQWRDVPVPVHAVRFPTPSADDTFKGATHTSSGLYDVE